MNHKRWNWWTGLLQDVTTSVLQKIMLSHWKAKDRENVCKHIGYKSPMSRIYRIYKKLSVFNNKKTKEIWWPKTEQLKKIYEWQISTWKGAQHGLSLEKSKIKPQWDTNTHLLE